VLVVQPEQRAIIPAETALIHLSELCVLEKAELVDPVLHLLHKSQAV
jgi:hypothetical protein